MKKEVSNVPELRFSGFDEDWQWRKLGEVCKIERGRFSPRPRNDPAFYGGEIPFVQTSDVVNSNGRISYYSQTLNEKGLAVSKLFPKGTILITIAANIGYTGVLQIAMACPDSLIGLTCKNGICDNSYLNIVLARQQRRMDYLAPEAAQKNINIDFLKPYFITFPQLPEQQKIASFLAAVDKKIEQLTRKKELLEQYKIGVMQKIFSQEIRFKDDNGQDYPDWEEKRLELIYPKVRNGFVGTATPFYVDNGVKYLQGKDVKNGIVNVLAPIYVSEEFHKKNNKSKLSLNDIVMVQSGHVGECAVVTEKYYNCNCHALLVLTPTDKVDSRFFVYYFYSNFGKKILYKIKTGNTIEHILASDIKKVIVVTPIPEEQQKIADFLASIDSKINTIQTQLTQTQNFKKGLLQKMFV